MAHGHETQISWLDAAAPSFGPAMTARGRQTGDLCAELDLEHLSRRHSEGLTT